MTRSLLQVLACLGLLALLFGCAPRQVGPPPPPSPAQLWQQADQAWTSGRYPLAEQLYSQLAGSDDLGPGQAVTAWKRLALSALENGHFLSAEQGLRKWAGLESAARSEWSWHQALGRSLLGQGRGEAWRRHLANVVQERGLPWELRQQAAGSLTELLVAGRLPAEAWRPLTRLHSQAPSTQARVELELDLLERLEGLDQDSLARLRRPLEGAPSAYPWAVVDWVRLRRALASGRQGWAEAGPELTQVVASAGLALTEQLRTQLAELAETYGPQVLEVALLLPLNGGYGSIGWKIAAGVDAAQWQLTQAGQKVRVRIINTQAPDWTSALEALPQEVRLVGGPLRQEAWTRIFEAGLHTGRLVFVFRSSLRPGEEGEDAFRFFPSSRDQVAPMVEAVTERFGMTNFAVLYPKAAYGRRMAKAFWEEVTARDGRLTGLDYYPPQDRAAWQGKVAEFLRVPESYGTEPSAETNATGPTKPQPDFGAVFLPDSLASVRMLVPEFFYFDEDRLLFLGPALWSQESTRISELDEDYFRLALMTGAWMEGRDTAAVRSLAGLLHRSLQGEPDFWTALGFDFLRFARRLDQGLADGQTPAEACPALQPAADMAFSMARLDYDAKGRATQDLFLFQPTDKGPVSADLERMVRRWTRVRARHRPSGANATATFEPPFWSETHGQN